MYDMIITFLEHDTGLIQVMDNLGMCPLPLVPDRDAVTVFPLVDRTRRCSKTLFMDQVPSVAV